MCMHGRPEMQIDCGVTYSNSIMNFSFKFDLNFSVEHTHAQQNSCQFIHACRKEALASLHAPMDGIFPLSLFAFLSFH